MNVVLLDITRLNKETN